MVLLICVCFCFLGCWDRYWTGSWRSDQHTQNQRTFWKGHWKPAAYVNQQTWQISWHSPRSEGLLCRFGRIVVGPPLHILNPKSILFHSHVIFSFTSFTFFPFSMGTIIVLWDFKVDVLWKDSRKDLHCPMGKNKKRLILHFCPLKEMVKLFTKYIWWDIAGLYFTCNKKEENENMWWIKFTFGSRDLQIQILFWDVATSLASTNFQVNYRHDHFQVRTLRITYGSIYWVTFEECYKETEMFLVISGDRCAPWASHRLEAWLF